MEACTIEKRSIVVQTRIVISPLPQKGCNSSLFASEVIVNCFLVPHLHLMQVFIYIRNIFVGLFRNFGFYEEKFSAYSLALLSINYDLISLKNHQKN